jgi:N-acetylneuraminic acid mutarotase
MQRLSDCLGQTIPQSCGHRMIVYGDNIYIQSGLGANFQLDTTLYRFNHKLCRFGRVKKMHFSDSNAVCTLVEYKDVLYMILPFEKTTVQTYRLLEDVWEEINFENAPMMLFGHTGTRINSKVYVHGGIDIDDFVKNKNFYCFDLEKHSVSKLGSTGPIPSDRVHHTMVTWEQKACLFGGVGGNMIHHNLFQFEGGTHYNDIWEYDPIDGIWSCLQLGEECKPAKRRSHASTVTNDMMFINGGFDGVNDFCDLWGFDLFLKRWKEYTNFDKIPSRRFHSMVAVRDSLYIYGGVASDRATGIALQSDFYQCNLNVVKSIKWRGFEDILIVVNV